MREIRLVRRLINGLLYVPLPFGRIHQISPFEAEIKERNKFVRICFSGFKHHLEITLKLCQRNRNYIQALTLVPLCIPNTMPECFSRVRVDSYGDKHTIVVTVFCYMIGPEYRQRQLR